MASNSISAARKTPIIGAFPKMFVPFIVILPGMVAAVLVKEIMDLKNGGAPTGGASGDVKYNDALLLLMRDVLPNGLLGLAIAGLLAAFMAGMAANISAFNTVFAYDLWERYIRKDRSDDYYLRIGRLATVAATIIAIFTASIAGGFSNIMDYLQTLFGFFNAPLFATFILGMFWKRMTPTAGWAGLVAGTLSAVLVAFLSKDAFGTASLGVIPLEGQGASLRRRVHRLRRRHPRVGRGLARHGAEAGVRASRVSSTPRRPRRTSSTRRRRVDPGSSARSRWPASPPSSSSSSTSPSKEVLDMADTKKTAGAFDIRNFIGMLLGLYGIILTLMGLFGDKEPGEDRWGQREPLDRPRAARRLGRVHDLGPPAPDRGPRPHRARHRRPDPARPAQEAQAQAREATTREREMPRMPSSRHTGHLASVGG